jgi:hypothetical protein
MRLSDRRIVLMSVQNCNVYTREGVRWTSPLWCRRNSASASAYQRALAHKLKSMAHYLL